MNQTAHPTALQVVYGFKSPAPQDDAFRQIHERILDQLAQAKARGLIHNFQVRQVLEGFEKQGEGKELLRQLRELAMRRKIKVRFGSRKYPYEWFPLQFLLVYRVGDLCEAFPCMLEGGYVSPETFLEHLLAGESWTVGGRRKNRGRGHDRIVDYLTTHSEFIEPALTFLGTEHPVSSASGETGSLDLLFRDLEGHHLIVEVKVNASELDEAVGKLGRYRRLFAETNHIEPAHIRCLLACPYIPEAREPELRGAGIEWRIVPPAALRELENHSPT